VGSTRDCGDEGDSWERVVSGGCYSRGKPWYHDQVGMSSYPTVQMNLKEPLSGKVKLASVIWIRAIKLVYRKLGGRGDESNAVVGSTDAGLAVEDRRGSSGWGLSTSWKFLCDQFFNFVRRRRRHTWLF
jgi:hypothetical protein